MLKTTLGKPLRKLIIIVHALGPGAIIASMMLGLLIATPFSLAMYVIHGVDMVNYIQNSVAY